jgi:hypothetical protein
MKKLYFLLFFLVISLFAFDSNAQCPTPGNTDIGPCWDGGAGGSGSVTFTFNDGVAPDGSIYRVRFYDYLSGGTGKFVYDSNNPDPSLNDVDDPIFNGNQLTFPNLPEGDYVLLLSNGGCGTTPGTFYGNGFTGGFTYSAIGVDETLDIEITLDNVFPACNGNDGEIQITASGGEGTFSYSWTGPTVIGNTDNPTGLSAGTYEVTVTDGYGCTEVLGGIEVITPTIANAGSDDSICQDTYNLNGNSVQTGETGSWSIISQPGGANAQIDNINDPNTLITDLLFDGDYTFRWTISDNTGTCADSDSDVIVTVANAATAEAGDDETVCEGDDLDLSASGTVSATNFSSLSWSTGGDGSFDDNTSLEPVYTPGAADITNGSVVLTLEATGNGTCDPATDNMTLTITPAPTADAGSDEDICEATAYDLSGSSTAPSASNFASLSWTTSGDGSFADNTVLAPVYTPGPNDATNGTVTLTLEATGNGSCAPVTSDVVMTIVPAPSATAGSDEEICNTDIFDMNDFGTAPTVSNNNGLEWSTSGSGTFGDATQLITNYSPSAADITAGSVTLTLTSFGNENCADATDDMTLTITPAPTAEAGDDVSICEGDDLDLSANGTVSATNFSTLSWSTAGDGSFDDNTALEPIYTPGATDITNGSVVLTLEATGNGSCATETASDNMTLTITAAPTAEAGDDETICEGDDIDLSASGTVSATNFSTLSWSTAGDGSFDDNTALEPIYTPGVTDITNGSVLLTLQANGNGGCPATTDDMTLTITPAPTAEAGDDETICEGDDLDLSASGTVSATNFSTLSWSTAGDGSFDDNTALEPIYTPGATDIANGNVVLTLEATGNGTCATTTATDNMTLTITTAPTAEAGDDETVCEGDDLDLSASGTVSATNFSTLSWSTSGDGGFDDNTALEPIYTPGATDIANGSVLLTLQANGNGGCPATTDNMTLTITPAPTAEAGDDETICEGDDLDLSVSGTVSATNFSTLSWSTAGDGSFDDNTALEPIYTPGATDLTNGSVILTLEATGNGTCAPVTDDMTLTITPAPTVEAGDDETICEGDDLDLSASGTVSATNFSTLSWSTAGDGSFDDNTALEPTYTPGATDITNGSVVLTLEATGNSACATETATDNMTLTITPAPTAEAGDDVAICEGDDLDLSASATVSATNFSTLSWSTAGDGSFDDNTALEPIYTPGATDIANGSVLLTLQANGNGGCPAITDNMTLTITPAPTAEAGDDVAICEGDDLDLSASATVSATNFSTLSWSTAGDGSFDDNTALEPIYTPGATDIANGTVVLTLETTGNGTCSTETATDNMTLTITPAPTAEAGDDVAICEGDDLDLSASGTVSATNFSTLSWSTSGDGSFDDNTALEPVYTPGSADITNGSVLLTLQANGNGGCPASTDNMTLTITPAPTAEAGNDETICEGDDLDLSVSGTVSATNFSTLSWSTAGDGSFDDNTALEPIYTPGATDLTNGSVILTLEATGNGTCDPVTDNMTLTITPAPTAEAGDDVAICEGNDLDLSASGTVSATNFSTLSWSTAGDGSFDDGTVLEPIYTPGATDITNGSVVLTLQANGNGSCPSTTDNMTLTITPAPTAVAGDDETICEGDDLDLSASGTVSATNFSSLSWSTGGDGSFDDDTILEPIYTPGAADITNGSVVLTLEATGNGTCDPATDNMTLTITPAPTADAGSDEDICEATAYDLSGSSTAPSASNFASLSWTTSGDGSFADNTVLAPVYTPGPNDATNGTVTLTLEATGNGSCAPVTSDVIMTIVPAPSATAGSDEEICSTDIFDMNDFGTAPTVSNNNGLEWSTSGSGTFGDATQLLTTYSPSAADITAGSVTLTLTAFGNENCADATDNMTLTITPAPTAEAGDDESICEGDDLDLSANGTVSATNFSAISWSTTGDGSFDDNTALEPVYTPGATDITNGSVVLTLEATGNSACATETASDNMTLTITAAPTAEAGDDETICEGDDIDLSASGTVSATNFSTLSWSTSGDGSFDDNTALEPIYTPGSDDITAGTVDLTLTAEGAGSCVDAVNSMTLTINAAPIAFAGDDQSFCDITEIDLSTLTNAPSAENGTIQWTTSSAEGTFNDQTLEAPVYTFGNDDISNGSVTLTVTVTGDAICGDATDEIIILIGAEPTIEPITDATICAGETLALNAIVNNETGIEWSTNGDGSFDDATILNAIYSPGVNDSTSGSVDISLTAFGGGTCSDSTYTFTLNINTIDIQLVNLDNTNGCGANDGAIDVDITSNGGGSLSIIWTGPNGFSSTDEDLTNLEAGIYEVQVTDDATGCVVTESFEIDDPVPFTIDLISVENQTECGVDDGLVEIEVNNGTGPFNYYIEDENGGEVDRLDNEAGFSYSFDALAPGDYQLFVEEGTCTDNFSFTINPVQEITAILDNTQLAACGNEDGEISIDVTQVANNNYDVVLFDDADVEIASELNQDGTTNPITFNSLGQGTYTVVVMDLVTNCEFNQEIVVNEAADFSITTIDVVDISNCENPDGSIVLSIDNPNGSTLTYTWENQDGDIVNVGGEESFLNITEPGIFDVTITDGTCTIIESNIEITQPAECDYDCEDFRVSPITEAATCLGLDDGKMFFLLRNVNKSSSELNFDIKPAVADDSLYHRFTVANIGQGLIVEIDTTFATGTYTVVASDPNLDCIADTVNINIGTKTTLSATIDIEQPTCTVSTGSISASISGTTEEFEYILYFEGDSITSNMTGVFADLVEGDYELEFINQSANSCGLSNRTFTIQNTAVVDQSAVSINISNPDCGEVFGSISVNLNNLPSNYEFILVDGNDEEIARNSTGIFNDVPEGTYVVQFENVIDPGACPIADRGGILIENDGSFSAVASDVEDIICFGENTGSAVITLEGISTGFYSLDNGQLWTQFTSGNRITGLPAVNNLLISDEPGTSDCELSVAVGIEYLSQPIKLEGTIELISQASCTVSEQVGEINVPAVTGGVAPYVFSIDGKVVELDVDRNIGGLARNVNQLIITDDTGCSESFDIRSIVSPNEVRAIVTEINPNNNCIDDPEGILVTIDEATIENVPGPYNLILNRVNETVTSEFILDINTNGSREFVIPQFNIDEDIPFIKGARYRWTVRAVDNDQACSADNFVTINGGAIIPTFDIEASDVACFQESGSIELFNIVADETIPLIIEVYEGNDIDPTETFTLNSIPESGRFVIDQSIYGMMTRGDYIVKLLQQPSNCSSSIESENASVFIDAPVAQLNVELVPEPNLPPGVERERTDMNPMPTTRPDRANGSISIRLVEPTSGANGYSAKIFLLTPLGGNNSSDYVLPSEAIDFGSDRTITFDNLLPGIYEIEYYDSFGCGLDGSRLVFDGEGSSDITVDFDRSPFIPNVFTPNNDGKNDFFRILNLPDNGAELIVTNRTGTIVYRDSNYRSSNLWDGGDNPDGIYFYQLTVDGNVQTGWVEIIRGKR